MVALGAGVFVFLSGCAVILLAPALARGWRAAAELGESDDVVHYGQFLRPLDESPIEPLAPSGTEHGFVYENHDAGATPRPCRRATTGRRGLERG